VVEPEAVRFWRAVWLGAVKAPHRRKSRTSDYGPILPRNGRRERLLRVEGGS